MSAACEHPDDEAVVHPNCAGCAQLMAQFAVHAEREDLTNTTREQAAWSAEPRPVDDLFAAPRELQHYASSVHGIPLDRGPFGPAGLGEARSAIVGPKKTPAYGLPVHRAWQPTPCPRCKNELSMVRDVAGSEWRCNACSARYPIGVQLAPSRPIAELRADLAELASVRAVLRDHDEWTGGALDVRREALLLQAEAIVGRIIGATIAGSAPSSTPVLEGRALEDEPRPGSWDGDEGADGRMLDQEQTDALIRRELFAQSQPFVRSHPAMLGAVMEIVGHPRVVPLYIQGVELTRLRNISGDHDGTWMDATRQRGGIDSDPLVRLLAFRAWGDRDWRWFEDRGVQKGDDCGVWPTTEG